MFQYEKLVDKQAVMENPDPKECRFMFAGLSICATLPVDTDVFLLFS